MLVFSTETSCDETSVCIMKEDKTVLSHIIYSQTAHNKHGGVVPELASRAHLEILQQITKEALKESGLKLSKIDLFSATCGPGLIGGLLIGSTFTKSLSIGNNKPFIPINHLEAHILSSFYNNKIKFPYLLLLISGGHTQFLIVKDINKYEQLGTTIDDALGEAFDKTAKMLGLDYPGGPNIENMAKLGDKEFFKLPEPIINRAGCNLSFAGLKTAVLREAKKINENKKLKYNLAASFQNTINKILYKKTKVAVNMFKEKTQKENFQLVVAGGVAANESIRHNLSNLSKKDIIH